MQGKSLSKQHNSKLAKKLKTELEAMGHKIKLGHAYDLISKMSGFPNWSTASTSDVALNPFAGPVKVTEPVCTEECNCHSFLTDIDRGQLNYLFIDDSDLEAYKDFQNYKGIPKAAEEMPPSEKDMLSFVLGDSGIVPNLNTRSYLPPSNTRGTQTEADIKVVGVVRKFRKAIDEDVPKPVLNWPVAGHVSRMRKVSQK